MNRKCCWESLIFVLLLACWPLSGAFHPTALKNTPFPRTRAGIQLHSMPPLLEDWRLLPNGRVEGRVVNHPDVEDGWVISTSPLKTNVEQQAMLGNDVIYVETLSGSQYLLVNRNREMTEGQMDQATPFFPRPTGTSPGMEMEFSTSNSAEPAAEKMSETKKLMQQVKDAGIAGVISYALWELGFWAVSVPVCIAAYRQVTGHWPDFSNQEDLQQLGAEAFAFVNVARFAVPLRIGLALGTTPWIQKNIVDRFQKGSSDNSNTDGLSSN